MIDHKKLVEDVLSKRSKKEPILKESSDTIANFVLKEKKDAKRHEELISSFKQLENAVKNKKNVTVDNIKDAFDGRVEVTNQKDFPEEINVKEPNWFTKVFNAKTKDALIDGVVSRYDEVLLALSKIVKNTANKDFTLKRYENKKNRIFVTPVDKNGDVIAPLVPAGGAGGGIKDGAYTNNGTSIAVTNPDGSNIGGGGEAVKDIFGYEIITSLNNQVELRLDDQASISDVVIETSTGDGDFTHVNGLYNVNANTGTAKATSTYSLEYRPGSVIYCAGTAVFDQGGEQWVGMQSTAGDSVLFGYSGTSFGIQYKRGGVEIFFKPISEWDVQIEGFDQLKNNLYKVESGLYGAVGFVCSIWSSTGFVDVLRYNHANTNTTPVFESNSFNIILDAQGGSIASQCWGAGTGSPLERLGAELHDQKLVQNTRAVISGKTTAGGGGYVDLKVNPSGTLQTNTEIEVDGNVISSTNPLPTIETKSPDTDVLIVNDSVNAKITYVGKALTGADKASPVWSIQKLDTTNGLERTWADGDSDFDNVWNNRETLTYL